MAIFDFKFSVGSILGFFVLYGLSRWLNRCHESRITLHKPPMVPTQYRLDAAMREAEAGFNTCPTCGFENFKRVSFCIACGAVVRHVEPATTTKQTPEEVPVVTIAVPNTQANTLRERRSRKRKEWTRQIDAQGQVVWHFNAADSADANRDFHTVHFQSRTEEIELELVIMSVSGETQDCAARSSGSAVPADRSGKSKPLVIPSRNELAKRAREAANAVAMDVVHASTGDMATFPLDQKLLAYSAVEGLQSEKLAFPTKYADFVVKATALLVSPEEHQLTFHVKRANLWEESIETLNAIPSQSLRWTMRIDFVKEAGIDAGGLAREWFVLMNEAMVDPANGVFLCVNNSDQSYYLNRHSAKHIGEDHLLYFLGVGRLIGRALLEGSALGFHLSLPLLKIILGVPVSLDDLEFYDPELYHSLLWIQDNTNVDELGLDFSVTEQIGGELVVVDLIPSGRNINVNDSNKAEFLERKFQYLLFESVSSQLYMFLKGLYEVMPPDLLAPFDVEELDYLLCGSDEIDVDDWERNTAHDRSEIDVVLGSTGCHQSCIWFWELVREMPNEYRRRLLQFATGSSRVPLAGFSALTSYDGKLCPFTLKGVKLVGDGFITSHACFNRLDLPLHNSRDQLKTVLYAILDTEVYGFTMD